ncbi:MAG: hypothetical protein AAF371_03180 [Pseudomonadota bacterium]
MAFERAAVAAFFGGPVLWGMLTGGVADAGASAKACETPPQVLLHVCEGEGAASLLLLPEDWPPADPERPDLLVTGAYTGKDTRADGAAAPVGLLIRDGILVGRNIARMDGILVIDPADGQPRLHRRGAVTLRGKAFDLSPLEERRAFFEAAGAAGASVLQSHLLVIDGAVDTSEVDGAPEAARRILYTKGGAFGIWQSAGPLTLDAAARMIAAQVAPDMALNLDMGSFDFCLARRPDAASEPCGVIDAEQMPGRLSNLLRLTRRAP